MSDLHRITGGERRAGTTLSDFINMGNGQRWMDDGACRQVDPELFHPDKGSNGDRAKTICGTCDVRVQCREWAVARPDEWGIWGGTSQEERKTMRRGRRVI